jgi:hypothetical protein
MGTRIPTPPFSTPSIDDLVGRRAELSANAPSARKRGARRVPVRSRRSRASMLALMIAVLVGAAVVALIARRE